MLPVCNTHSSVVLGKWDGLPRSQDTWRRHGMRGKVCWEILMRKVQWWQIGQETSPDVQWQQQGRNISVPHHASPGNPLLSLTEFGPVVAGWTRDTWPFHSALSSVPVVTGRGVYMLGCRNSDKTSLPTLLCSLYDQQPKKQLSWHRCRKAAFCG